MEADGPMPGAEHSAADTEIVIPTEADVASAAAGAPSITVRAALMAGVPSTAEAAASTAVDAPTVVADAATAAAHAPSVEAGAALVAADIVEADTVEVVPMEVGTARFRHNEKLSRPAAYAAGRFLWTVFLVTHHSSLLFPPQFDTSEAMGLIWYFRISVWAVLRDIQNFAEGGAVEREKSPFPKEHAAASLRNFREDEEESCRLHYPRCPTLPMPWSLPLTR
jgi:hypothetical protein